MAKQLAKIDRNEDHNSAPRFGQTNDKHGDHKIFYDRKGPDEKTGPCMVWSETVIERKPKQNPVVQQILEEASAA